MLVDENIIRLVVSMLLSLLNMVQKSHSIIGKILPFYRKGCKKYAYNKLIKCSLSAIPALAQVWTISIYNK